MNYETVIGLEVHVQLKTESKAFCGCSTKFGAQPNTNTCPVCLGLPGVLPVLNKKAVEYAVMTGIALHCSMSDNSKFDRKNYFYPDLPKAYQISQYDKPLSFGGYLDINLDKGTKRIKIKRVHLEEDAGKLIHSEKGDESYVDYNRAGIPLLEIVSEPDISNPEEAYLYLTNLKQILQYLGVSDCNMEEGSLRCDANISLRPEGAKELGVKAEVKNMNSFKNVEKALNYEIKRQEEALSRGQKIVQETRLWNATAEYTHPMRSKEEAHDYRYFPEPDLAPVKFSAEKIEEIRTAIPEMPHIKLQRFVSVYNIPHYDAGILTGDICLADYFERAVKSGGSPKLISNWIMSELLRELNQQGITADNSPVPSDSLSSLVRLIESGTISGKIAKTVFEEMYKTGKSPEIILKEKDLVQINSKDELTAVVDKVISGNTKSVNDYQKGKEEAFMHLVGQVMRHTKGKANPGIVQQLLKERLNLL